MHLGSYLRCLGRGGGAKRDVFEGSRGSLLRVLQVVRGLKVFDGRGPNFLDEDALGDNEGCVGGPTFGD